MTINTDKRNKKRSQLLPSSVIEIIPEVIILLKHLRPRANNTSSFKKPNNTK